MRKAATTRKGTTDSIIRTATQPMKRSTAETSMRRALEPQKNKKGSGTRKATVPIKRSIEYHSESLNSPNNKLQEIHHKVIGDGNCYFRAVSLAIFGN